MYKLYRTVDVNVQTVTYGGCICTNCNVQWM